MCKVGTFLWSCSVLPSSRTVVHSFLHTISGGFCTKIIKVFIDMTTTMLLLANDIKISRRTIVLLMVIILFLFPDCLNF